MQTRRTPATPQEWDLAARQLQELANLCTRIARAAESYPIELKGRTFRSTLLGRMIQAARRLAADAASQLTEHDRDAARGMIA